MRLSTATLLGGLVASTAALSDLDASVWEKLESGHARRSSFRRYPRNRPHKRADGWNPPASLTTALSEVWAHYIKTYDGGIDGNTNWGWQQVMANDGHLNICVRWDSNQTVTAAQRTKIATVYNEQYQKWFEWVYGYDGFPYTKVGVNIVGWAVSDTSLLEGSTSDIDVYTDVDDDGIPMCALGCSRDAHLDSDYSGCTGGSDSHFDQSLWLTDGLDGGYGYSWGQQVGREYFMNNIDADNLHILLHEMGHTFGLDDFYDWTPTGVSNFIMLAGSATEITTFDGWMYRNWWYKLAAEHGWGSSNSSSSTTSAASTATAASTVSAAAIETTEATETTATEVAAEDFVQATPSSPSTPEAPVYTPIYTPVYTPVQTPVQGPAETPVYTSAYSTPTPVSGSGTVAKWYQCGGANWSGETECASGLTCVVQNEYYSQCL